MVLNDLLTETASYRTAFTEDTEGIYFVKPLFIDINDGKFRRFLVAGDPKFII
jgi:hypothetical protein